MRIAHFAPFAPHRAGLYETTRDIIVAERLAGADAELIDIGVSGVRQVGAVDARPTGTITAMDYDWARTADVLVSNGGILDGFVRETTAPVVQIMHGRPESSFRLSQRDPKVSPVYDLYSRRGKDPRWSAFISLWREHLPYWRVVVPEDKLMATSAPPCDLDQFTPGGARHAFSPAGDINVLVADMWRPDADPYHAIHGLIEASRRLDGMKVHVYACQTPLGPWEHVFRYMRREGILGEAKGIMLGFDRVLRAADLVVTPHRIATRIVREALACGTRVVDGKACDFQVPGQVASAVLSELRSTTRNPREDAARFGLDRIGPELMGMYDALL